MRRAVLLLLLLLLPAGCGGSAPEGGKPAAHPGFQHALRQVLNAFGNARKQAALVQNQIFIIHFHEDFITVWRDQNRDGTLDERKDRLFMEYRIRQTDFGIVMRAPVWLACDHKGRIAYEKRGRPPSIEFEAPDRKWRMVLKLNPNLLDVMKVEYYTEGSR